jgi:hypothetical protein
MIIAVMGNGHICNTGNMDEDRVLKMLKSKGLKDKIFSIVVDIDDEREDTAINELIYYFSDDYAEVDAVYCENKTIEQEAVMQM